VPHEKGVSGPNRDTHESVPNDQGTEDLTQPIEVGAWNNLIRMADITAARKLACLVVSSYANADGTRIFCGVARLATDMRCGYSTAQRHLAWMREVKLIERVQEGNARRGQSDVYRLILHPTAFEKIDIPDPTTYRALVERKREDNRAKQKRNQTSPKARSEKCAKPAVGETTSDLTQGEVCTADQTSLACASDLALGEVPPTMPSTNHLKATNHRSPFDGRSPSRVEASEREDGLDGGCLVCRALAGQPSHQAGKELCDAHVSTSASGVLALKRALRHVKGARR